MNESSFAAILARPPGDGISVTPFETVNAPVGFDALSLGAKIRISGHYTITRKRVLIALVFTAVLLATGIGISFIAVTKFGMPSELASMAPLILGAMPFLFLLFRGIEASQAAQIEIDDEEIEISFRNERTRLRWNDVASVRAVEMNRSGEQLFPDLNNPFRKGRGDGIAFETPQGEFRCLAIWHHEVSQWLVELIVRFASENQIKLRAPVHHVNLPPPQEF